MSDTKIDDIFKNKAECVCLFVLLPFAFIGLSLWFFFVHREISFRQARLIRAVLIHDRVWPWWHIGFMPWFTINLALMRYDWKKDALSVRIKAGKRALDAFARVRQAFTKDDDMRDLFCLWKEFQIRDEASFNARDRSMFMTRMGSLFNEPTRIFLKNAILLRVSDYLVFKYLCCKACRMMEERIRSVGLIESTLVTYFIDHKAECCQKIQDFKPTILTMARKYVDNMIAFCITHDLTPASHLWARAGMCIVRLQGLDPTDDNEPALLHELDQFIALFEQASGPVYAKYVELDRAERERQSSSSVVVDKEALTDEERWPYLHRNNIHRFKFRWKGHSLTITDTHHRESDHKFVTFDDITPPQALDVLEELMKAYDDGPIAILPLGKDSWQSNMVDAAGDFIKRETETWSEAFPNSNKEEKRLHKRYRRVIQDGFPLREIG